MSVGRRSQRARLVAILSLAYLVAACGSDKPSPTAAPPSAGSSSAIASAAATAVASASAATYPSLGESLPTCADPTWRCLTVDVPLDRSDPSRGTIPIHAYIQSRTSQTTPRDGAGHRDARWSRGVDVGGPWLAADGRLVGSPRHRPDRSAWRRRVGHDRLPEAPGRSGGRGRPEGGRRGMRGPARDRGGPLRDRGRRPRRRGRPRRTRHRRLRLLRCLLRDRHPAGVRRAVPGSDPRDGGRLRVPARGGHRRLLLGRRLPDGLASHPRPPVRAGRRMRAEAPEPEGGDRGTAQDRPRQAD